MRTILHLHLAIGLFLVSLGFMAATRPYLLLDTVLTQEELRDQSKKDATQSLLLMGAGSDSTLMFVSGIILSGTSLIGVFLGYRHRCKTPDEVNLKNKSWTAHS